MRPPRTAKDDQPGPTGRRHSATGGDAVQSVLIRTPGMTSSRWGPRKPGQMGPVSASAGAGGSATGSLPDLATDRKSTRLNSSHLGISYAVFFLKKKNKIHRHHTMSSDKYITSDDNVYTS